MRYSVGFDHDPSRRPPPDRRRSIFLKIKTRRGQDIDDLMHDLTSAPERRRKREEEEEEETAGTVVALMIDWKEMMTESSFSYRNEQDRPPEETRGEEREGGVLDWWEHSPVLRPRRGRSKRAARGSCSDARGARAGARNGSSSGRRAACSFTAPPPLTHACMGWMEAGLSRERNA